MRDHIEGWDPRVRKPEHGEKPRARVRWYETPTDEAWEVEMVNYLGQWVIVLRDDAGEALTVAYAYLKRKELERRRCA